MFEMKSIALVFFLIFYIGHSDVSAAMSFSIPDPHRRPGGCYLAEIGHFLAGDKIQPSGECSETTCQPSGSMEKIGCGVRTNDFGVCTIIEPPSLPHPACCSDVICPGP